MQNVLHKFDLSTVTPMESGEHPLNILLVEDEQSDALLTRIALDATQIPYSLSTLPTGGQVIPYLYDALQKHIAPLPDVIMLDLGLPGIDGFEILAGLSILPEIQKIPIVILTGHKQFEYLRKTYDLWIPAYVTKPFNAEKMHEVLNRVRYRGNHPVN